MTDLEIREVYEKYREREIEANIALAKMKEV